MISLSFMKKNNGESQIYSIFLIILIMILLFFVILSYCLGFFNRFFEQPTLAPAIIQVISVSHIFGHGSTNLASRVSIQNMGRIEYRNRDLQAVFFRNEKKLFAIINTLHGENFVPTQHFGVSTMGGSGCRGEFFSPGEKILIDLKNGYYAPGDRVEVRIYQRNSGSSPTSYPITGLLTDSGFMKSWLDENIYSSRPGYHLLSQHRFSA